MVKENLTLSKLNFLDVSTKTEVHCLNWLTAYFIFCAGILLLASFLPDFVRQYSFQLFLIVAMIATALLTSWMPILRISRKAWVWMLVGLILYFGFLSILNIGLGLAGISQSPQLMQTRSDLWLLVLVAPVVEELFFRDLLFRSLYHRTRKLWLAVFISSLFFMVAHLTLYPGAFLMGLIGTALLVATRSLWPAILFHAVSNLSLLFLPVWFPNVLAALERWELFGFFYR
jgi:membrane protease YdiL (CAAX protease family)